MFVRRQLSKLHQRSAATCITYGLRISIPSIPYYASVPATPPDVFTTSPSSACPPPLEGAQHTLHAVEEARGRRRGRHLAEQLPQRAVRPALAAHLSFRALPVCIRNGPQVLC